MRKTVVALACFLLFVSAAYAQNGLVNVKSSHDVKTTTSRLVKVLKTKGMKVFAEIDFTKGAREAGTSLRPMYLVVFGNPKIGTVLMQTTQTAGIDLPMKALIWRDDKGQVWFTYNDPNYIAERHGIKGCEKVLAKMRKALAAIATAATKP